MASARAPRSILKNPIPQADTSKTSTRTRQNVVTNTIPLADTTTVKEVSVPVTTDLNQTSPTLVPYAGNENSNDGEEGKSKSFFKRIFANRKKPSIRMKEKKLRQARGLKKVLHPKNALMALNELKTVKLSEIAVNNKQGGGFTAVLTVNNIQYEGSGTSKSLAKNDVCEKAFRDIVISKMIEKASKSSETTGENGDKDNGKGEDVEMKSVDKEDDISILNLASFAIYKLFTEWKNEGFKIPDFPSKTQKSDSMEVDEKPKKPTIRHELPVNWDTMHPTILLGFMVPGVVYIELGEVASQPHPMQRVGVTIDEEKFTGLGRSKKVARRNVAAAATNKLFGTSYEIVQ